MHSNILIVGPAWVGDMVMAQSLFKLLKQRANDCNIDVVAPAWTISLLSRMPEINRSFNAPFTHLKFEFLKHYELAKQLRPQQYDQVILLPNTFKSAISPWLAGIKKRTGWRGEHRYFALNDLRHLDKTRYPLMIERFMALGLEPNEPLPKPYPYPEFKISAESIATSLQQHQPICRGRPILAMCIGAEFGPAKQWPATYYAHVANEQLNAGWDIWLVGSKNDAMIAEEIMTLTENRCDNLAGRVGLAETIDLLTLVTGVLTNDSGLMHVAAALNKPVIVLYGSTSPEFTPPLTDNATILKLNMDCQPCFKRTCSFGHYHCLVHLKPERVLSVISQWSIE